MKGSRRIYVLSGVIILILMMCFQTDVYASGFREAATEVSEADQNDGQDGGGKLSKKVIKNNFDFDVTLELGFDGYVEYYKGCRVKVTVESDKNFSGRISVSNVSSVSGDMDTVSAKYSKEVSLAAGETNVHDYYLKSIDEGCVMVSITDEDGNEVYSERDAASQLSSNTSMLTLGVLSSDMSACTYMSTAKISTTEGDLGIRLVDLPENDLPESGTAYDCIDYILIDGFDTSGITAEQYDAIKSWCMSGGSVILALGSDAQRVVQVFDDDFLDIELGSASKKNINFNIIVSESGEDEYVDTASFENVPITRFEVEGAELLDDISEGADVYVKKEGRGQIIVLPYSLVTAPLARNGQTGDVAACIIEGSISSRVLGKLNGSSGVPDYYGYNAASASNKRSSMSPMSIIVALIIYIILSGPVTYIVLKKLRKRELIWVVVPAWAVIGTVTIFVVSLKYRVTKPVNSTFMTIDLGGDYMLETMYTNVVTSKTGEYTLKIDDKYDDVSLSDSFSDYYYLTDGSSGQYQKTAELTEGASGKSVTYYNSSAFGSIGMEAVNVESNYIGNFGDELKLYTDGFEGTVTNNTSYDMTNVFVLSDSDYYVIEELPSGASADISRSENISYAGMYYYQSVFNEYYMSAYGTDEYGYEVPDDVDSQNQYMKYYFDCYKSPNHKKGQILIWATIDDPETMIAGDDTENYTSCVVYEMKDVSYEDAHGVFYSSIYDAAETNDNWDSYDMMMYMDEVDIQVRFNVTDDIDELIYKGQREESAYDIDTYAYNSQTGKFELIFEGDTEKVLSGEELSKYISGSTMYLRFSPSGNSGDGSAAYVSYLPYISAKGGESGW